MLIAKVTGSLVATEKVGSMVGFKLSMVEPYRVDPKTWTGQRLTSHRLPEPLRGDWRLWKKMGCWRS